MAMKDFINMFINEDASRNLGRTIVELPGVYINYWTIVHMINGAFLGFILDLFIKTTPLIMLVLHTFWELTEYTAFQLSGNTVLDETFTNKVWDTIGFMIGYYIYSYFKNK